MNNDRPGANKAAVNGAASESPSPSVYHALDGAYLSTAGTCPPQATTMAEYRPWPWLPSAGTTVLDGAMSAPLCIPERPTP
jgi:hypothetical protein